MNTRLQHEFAAWRATGPSLDVELTTSDIRRAAQVLKRLDADADTKQLKADFAIFLLQYEVQS